MALREELFLAAACFGLHRRWKEAKGKKFADTQLESMGLDCCAGASKMRRVLYLGMLVQRFPVFGEDFFFFLNSVFFSVTFSSRAAFQSVLTRMSGGSGWENVGKWTPKVLFDTLKKDAELCAKFDELAKQHGLVVVVEEDEEEEEEEGDIAPILHVHGYEIYRKQFLIESLLLVKRLIKFGLDGEKNEQVFQYGAGDDDELNDGNRLQRSLDQFDDDDDRDGGVFLEQVAAKIKEWFPQHQVNDGVVLVSKPGCVSQAAHADYQYDEVGDDEEDASMPLGLIVALMDETYFDAWPRAIRYDDVKKYDHKQLVLNAGDVLVFRGDFFHAGAAFEKLNARLHYYLDMEGVERTRNVTFYADEEHGFYNLGPRKEKKKLN